MDVQTVDSQFDAHGPAGRRRLPQPIRREPLSRPQKDRALVDTLTIAVHGLRGPIVNLQAMLELIEADRERRTLAQVRDCARRAQDIIATRKAH